MLPDKQRARACSLQSEGQHLPLELLCQVLRLQLQEGVVPVEEGNQQHIELQETAPSMSTYGVNAHTPAQTRDSACLHARFCTCSEAAVMQMTQLSGRHTGRYKLPAGDTALANEVTAGVLK
jgi:hypothetical protein